MVVCCVPFCVSKSGKSRGISFHDFPLDDDRKQEWLKAISRKDYVPHTNSYSQAVCSLHFLPSDYKPGLKNRCLKPSAIPSVFPGYSSYKVSKLTAERRTIKKRSLPTKQNTRRAVKDVSVPSRPCTASSSSNSGYEDSNLESDHSSSTQCFADACCQTSRTDWTEDEELNDLRRQNAKLRAKICRSDETIAQLQSKLDEVTERLNDWEKDKELEAALNKIKESYCQN